VIAAQAKPRAPVGAVAARVMVFAVALVALAAPRPARAQDANRPVFYRVRQGDTLDLIAAEFYGDRTRVAFLMVENRLLRPRPLRPGERLRIPVNHDITTGPGDTFESLAMTYLGSARRGTFLADWNATPQDESLPAGTRLMIPFTVVHVAQATEALADVARAYFGDGKQAEMLRRYNFLDRAVLDKGESLIVPAYHIRVSPAKQPGLDTESRARAERRREATGRAARALPAARLAWKTGDFAAVKTVLVPIEPDLDYLDASQAVDIAVLLGAAHVAYEDAESATVCFKRALDRQAQHALRRYDYSPKVLALWQKAGGPVE